MARARSVAILHVCVESVAILFCRAFWCVLAAPLAIVSSSTVACCCKQRRAYSLWSVFGGFVGFLHALAATTEALYVDEAYRDRSAFVFTVQIVLCLISMLVFHYGFRVASLLREPILAAEMQVSYAQAGLSP